MGNHRAPERLSGGAWGGEGRPAGGKGVLRERMDRIALIHGDTEKPIDRPD